jgi:hypothetical protein
MVELPTGTVTFLMTDIVGSARLRDRYGNLMRSALAQHDELIEDVVARQGGRLVRPRGEGDTAAVATGGAIQLALMHESWSTPEPLSVRIALHTGEADLRDGHYWAAPSTAALGCVRSRTQGRYCSRARLPSSPARNSRRASGLRDVGAYRLKDALELASDESVDVVLRAVPDPWPFPAHLRVVPELVAALDLAESVAPALADLGCERLTELGDGLEPSWDRRPPRRRPLRSPVPARGHTPRPHPHRKHSAVTDAVWDDRAEQDARGLVALLFVAGGMRRAELAEALHLSAGRLDRACAFLTVSPPHGLVVLGWPYRAGLGTRLRAPDRALSGQAGARSAVSGGAGSAVDRRLRATDYPCRDQPHPWHRQQWRDRDAARAPLIEDDPRFGGRGRPSFLATTADFLRTLGLSSLGELPPRPVPSSAADDGQPLDSAVSL